MVRLLVNGEFQSVPEAATLRELLTEMNLEADSIAVAVDGCFLPRSRYADFRLEEDQALEILSPMQGG
jgi:sulfur carrier protein